VAKLEKLFSNVLRALKPDGLVYLDEYIGPSRFDWNDDLIAPHRRFFDRIPREVRSVDPLRLPI
jgi:SAM-dependent methyltransferase